MIKFHLIFVLELVLFLVGARVFALGKFPLGKRKAIVDRDARWIGWWLMLALPVSLGIRVLWLAIPIHVMGKKEFIISWAPVPLIDICTALLFLVFAGIGLIVFSKVNVTDTRHFRARWVVLIGVMALVCIGLAGAYATYLTYYQSLLAW